MAKPQKAKMPKVVFSPTDFKIADRFGKMYMRMLQPTDFQLNDRDENYYRRLMWLYPMVMEQQPQRIIIAKLQELDGGLWRNQAVGMIQDAERLIAYFGRANKRLDRLVQHQELLELIYLVKQEFLQKETIEKEDEDGNATMVEQFKVPREQILQAVETIRRLRADIAKNAQLDQPDNDTEGDSMPEVEFDETKFEAELAEYEEIAKNTVHEQAQSRLSSAVE
jgi:hypothetical protein